MKSLLALMKFRNEHPAFDGGFELLDCTDDKFVILRKNGDEWAKLNADFAKKTFEVIYSENGGEKFLITKNYIEVPVVMESELITLEVMQENGDSQTKICEFQVPAGASTGGFKPDYFVRFTVKDFTGKTLILKGRGNEAFFAGIRQVDCEFEESDLDFSNESLPRPKYHFTAKKRLDK